jgi:hypothetical protein
MPNFLHDTLSDTLMGECNKENYTGLAYSTYERQESLTSKT